MATSTDSGPSAASNLATGAVTASRSFVLPASPRYIVQSVTATVVNTAGGDTTGTLTVTDPSGEVIGAVEQGRTITAGVTGRATWALRLADEATASASVTGTLGVYLDLTRAIAPINNDVRFDFLYDSGSVFLDLTFPTFATFVAAGTYIVTAHAYPLSFGSAAGKSASLKMFSLSPGVPEGTASQTAPLDAVAGSLNVSATIPRVVAAGDFLVVTMAQDVSASENFGCALNIVKIG